MMNLNISIINYFLDVSEDEFVVGDLAMLTIAAQSCYLLRLDVVFGQRIKSHSGSVEGPAGDPTRHDGFNLTLDSSTPWLPPELMSPRGAVSIYGQPRLRCGISLVGLLLNPTGRVSPLLKFEQQFTAHNALEWLEGYPDSLKK